MALGESILNTLVAKLLGFNAKHCEGIGNCVKLARRASHAAALFIDYEVESGARRVVDELLRQLKCACSGPVNGVRCCECEESSIVVLFEGGPEGSLEALGYRVDTRLRDLLEPQKLLRLYRGGGRVKHLVDSLVAIVRGVCGIH